MDYVQQIVSMANEMHGYLDKVVVEAREAADRASKLQPAVQEYGELMKKIAAAKEDVAALEAEKVKAVDAKKAELAAVNADLKQAEAALQAFRDMVAK